MVKIPNVCLLVLLCIGFPVQAQQMFLSGKFQVGQQGEAGYSVPIEAVPGVAGMQPALALAYSSQGGNGLMGIGWGINGLSSIGRCPQTKAQDGANGRVSYTSSDRFCLDGQRLVLFSGTYGAAGSEYRTELDGQLKVIAYGGQYGCPKTGGGACSNAPQYFKVWTKSGQIVEYGNTANSRIEAEGTTVPSIWLQNRILDRQNNYIDWVYSENNATGEWYPTHIKYTGNLITGATAKNTIQFVYENRPDPVAGYSVGSKSQYTQRLSKVQVLQDTTNVREYRVEYEVGALSRLSRAKAIRQCAASGCLAPLQLTWSDATPSPVNTGIAGGHGVAAGDSDKRFVDLFGDGKPVYYGRTAEGTHCATRLHPEGGYTNWQWPDATPVGDGGWDVVDLFGDGRLVYYTHWKDGRHYAARLNPDHSKDIWNWTGGHYTSEVGWRVVDLFGDGKPVFYTHSTSGRHYASRLNQNDTVNNWEWSAIGTQSRWEMVDLFGDGKPVFYTYKSIIPDLSDGGSAGGGTHYAVRFKQDKTLESWRWSTDYYVAGEWKLVDLFGDGQPVFFAPVNEGRQFMASRMNADGKVQNWTWDAGQSVEQSTENGKITWEFHDLFGEGKPVYVARAANGEPRISATRFDSDGASKTWNWSVTPGGRFVDLFGNGQAIYYRNSLTPTTGAHFSTRFNADGSSKTWDLTGGHGLGNGGWELVDLFGEGRPVYYTFTSTGDHYVTRFVSKKIDLLTKVASVVNASTNITYTPLTNPSVYTKGTGTAASYPVVDVQAPMYVVSKVQASNGAGGLRTSNYQYGGLKAEAGSGRGSLGFAWHEVKDPDTNVSIRTDYLQAYPFTGSPAQMVRKIGNQVLGKTNSDYGYFSYSNGTSKDASPSLGAGKRYLVYGTQTIEHAWELNGAFISGTRTVQGDIDDYANVGTLLIESVNAANKALGYSKTTQSTYKNDSSSWILGRLQRTTVSNQVPNTILSAGVQDAANAQISGVDTSPPANHMVGKGVWLPAVLDLILQ